LPFHHVLSDPAVAVTRTVTVAAGRCAPGNLGELTAVVPLELVDAVPEETRSVQRRPRDLPSRDGVYLLLAMCLFPEVGAMTLVATPILAEQSCRSRVPVLWPPMPGEPALPPGADRLAAVLATTRGCASVSVGSSTVPGMTHWVHGPLPHHEETNVVFFRGTSLDALTQGLLDQRRKPLAYGKGTDWGVVMHDMLSWHRTASGAHTAHGARLDRARGC
jgi:hypothetical protein